MSEIIKKIKDLAKPIIDEANSFLVDVAIRGERSSKVIEIYADSDTGITIDQITQISRKISEILDTENIIDGRYRLDVSSPDLERPLKIFRQYHKNIGRHCKVQYSDNGIIQTQEGILLSVDDTKIVLEIGKKATKEIFFTSIVETFIIPKIK
jgi:ribosome maturation factor RimP